MLRHILDEVFLHRRSRQGVQLYPQLEAAELRAEFLKKMSQTPTEDTVEADEEMDQEDALEDEALVKRLQVSKHMLLRRRFSSRLQHSVDFGFCNFGFNPLVNTPLIK